MSSEVGRGKRKLGHIQDEKKKKKVVLFYLTRK